MANNSTVNYNPTTRQEFEALFDKELEVKYGLNADSIVRNMCDENIKTKTFESDKSKTYADVRKTVKKLLEKEDDEAEPQNDILSLLKEKSENIYLQNCKKPQDVKDFEVPLEGNLQNETRLSGGRRKRRNRRTKKNSRNKNRKLRSKNRRRRRSKGNRRRTRRR